LKKEPILTDWDIEFEPQPRPLLRSKSILMHMNKRKRNQKPTPPPPCQTKKTCFFLTSHHGVLETFVEKFSDLRKD
jgi:hypothetical protein